MFNNLGAVIVILASFYCLIHIAALFIQSHTRIKNRKKELETLYSFRLQELEKAHQERLALVERANELEIQRLMDNVNGRIKELEKITFGETYIGRN